MVASIITETQEYPDLVFGDGVSDILKSSSEGFQEIQTYNTSHINETSEQITNTDQDEA